MLQESSANVVFLSGIRAAETLARNEALLRNRTVELHALEPPE